MEKKDEDGKVPVDVPSSQSAPPRENMITTAVKFLQNPKVRESSFAQRRMFLEKKGLTEAEIQEAIARSGTAADETATPPAAPAGSVVPVGTYQQPAGSYPYQVQPYNVAPPSTWQRVRDFTATTMVIGGVSYAVYQFFKYYIAPHWFGPSRQEKQLTEVEASVRQLKESLDALVQAVEKNQQTLSEQNTSITDIAKQAAGSRGSTELQRIHEDQSASEIKEEIKSLKGLLLSRKQFPTPSTKPIIPSWQLNSANSENAGNSENSQTENSKQDQENSNQDISSQPTNADVQPQSSDSAQSESTSGTLTEAEEDKQNGNITENSPAENNQESADLEKPKTGSEDEVNKPSKGAGDAENDVQHVNGVVEME